MAAKVGGRVAEYALDIGVAPAVGEQVALVAGLNLITLPVEPIDTLTVGGLAQQVADQGGEVAQVSRWDEEAQSYNVWRDGAADFDLRVGEAYFVLVATPPTGGVWSVVGRQLTEPTAIAFVRGLNLVGLPLVAPVGGYDAPGLAQAIGSQGGGVAQIVKWDLATQTFGLWSAESPDANVFAIEGNAGYFVLIVQAGALPFQP